MTFEAENILKIKDAASATLGRIIKKLEDTQKAFTNLEAMVARVETCMKNFGVESIKATSALTGAGKAISNLNTRISNLETRSRAAGSGLSDLGLMVENFETRTMLMNDSLTRTIDLLNDIRANSTIRMNISGRTGIGGGGGAHMEEEHGHGLFGHVGNTIASIPGRMMDHAFTAMIGMDLAKEALKPMIEYQQQIGTLQFTGLKSNQVQQAQVLADRIAREVPGTTRTENLKSIKEMYGLTRNFDTTMAMSKEIAKLDLALKFAGNKNPALHGEEFTQAVVKAADMLGEMKPENLRSYIKEAYASYVSSGGLVNPLMLAKEIKSERSSSIGKDKDWMGVRTYLLEEEALGRAGGGAGGQGGPGVGLESMTQIMARGHMNKMFMRQMAEAGLMERPKMQALDTTTTRTITKPALKDLSLFLENPFKWSQKYAVPLLAKQMFPKMPEAEAIKAYQGSSKGEQQKAILQSPFAAMGNRTALTEMTHFLTQGPQIQLAVDARKKALDVEKSLDIAYEETGGKVLVLQASFEQLIGTIGIGLAPAVNRTLDALNAFMGAMNRLDLGLPKTFKSMQDFNNSMFGTNGAFEKTSAVMKAINWKPMLEMLDKILAFSLQFTAKSTNKLLDWAKDDIDVLTGKKKIKQKTFSDLKDIPKQWGNFMSSGGPSPEGETLSFLKSLFIPDTNSKGFKDRVAEFNRFASPAHDRPKALQPAPVNAGAPTVIHMPISVHGTMDKQAVEGLKNHVKQAVISYLAKSKFDHMATSSLGGGNWQSHLLAVT